MRVEVRFIVVLLLLGGCLTVRAYEGQELFLQGNKSYNEANYSAAYDYYCSITNKGYAAWYNMGNCCYKIGQQKKALYCWYKARSCASYDQYGAIAQVIDVVASEVGIHDRVDVYRWHRLYEISLRFPLIFLQLLFLFVWALILFYGTLLFTNKRYWLIVLLSLILIITTALLSIRYYYGAQSLAFVKNETCLLYTGPDDKYCSIGTLSEGDVVLVKEQRDEWLKVATNFSTGWIQRQEVDEI